MTEQFGMSTQPGSVDNNPDGSMTLHLRLPNAAQSGIARITGVVCLTQVMFESGSLGQAMILTALSPEGDLNNDLPPMVVHTMLARGHEMLNDITHTVDPEDGEA